MRQQKREVELALKLAELCSSTTSAARRHARRVDEQDEGQAKDLASVSFGDCLLFVVAGCTVTPLTPEAACARPHTPALPADPLAPPPKHRRSATACGGLLGFKRPILVR